ncbi:hypothetical protein D9M71_728400 [compost metagenome]
MVVRTHHQQEDYSMNISQNALIKRINRKLAHEGQRLCTARQCWNNSTGGFYITDAYTIVVYHIELEPLARELGVLPTDWRIV